MKESTKLVKNNYTEKELKLAKENKKIKNTIISFWLDLIKMIILGVMAIAMIMDIIFLSVREGNCTIPSFWLAMMSLWILLFSIGRGLLNNRMKTFVDVFYLISMIVIIVIAAVCMVNEWYNDSISLVISTVCFVITIGIETRNCILIFKEYYRAKQEMIEKEIERIRKESPMKK